MDRVINKDKQTITIDIRITMTKARFRLRKRANLADYPVNISATKDNIDSSIICDWQIKSDIEVGKYPSNEKLEFIESGGSTTFNGKPQYNTTFKNNKSRDRYLYELSEFIHYFKSWGVITNEEIETLKKEIENPKYFDEYAIELDSKTSETINGIDAEVYKYKYPSFIIKDKTSNYYIEILNKEQDSGSKIQPQLFVRFPASSITNKSNGLSFIGQPVPSKSIAQFTINKSNIHFFLKALKILGCLSETHNADVKEMIKIL